MPAPASSATGTSCWVYDRAPRLWCLVLRIREHQEYLTRLWVEADPDGRRGIEGRLRTLARRLARLRSAMRDPRDGRRRYGGELPEMWCPPWGEMPRVGRGA